MYQLAAKANLHHNPSSSSAVSHLKSTAGKKDSIQNAYASEKNNVRPTSQSSQRQAKVTKKRNVAYAHSHGYGQSKKSSLHSRS